jgi:putative redox protein
VELGRIDDCPICVREFHVDSSEASSDPSKDLFLIATLVTLAFIRIITFVRRCLFMTGAKPQPIVRLKWEEGLRFTASHRSVTWSLDGKNEAGPSPVIAMASALAGCMAVDIVHILTRGRHAVRALEATFVGERAETDPKRFVRIDVHFKVTASAPREAVERAIELSHEKYCSVWHSMRQDIPFRTDVEIVPLD